jgi:hypothetical protein
MTQSSYFLISPNSVLTLMIDHEVLITFEAPLQLWFSRCIVDIIRAELSKSKIKSPGCNLVILIYLWFLQIRVFILVLYWLYLEVLITEETLLHIWFSWCTVEIIRTELRKGKSKSPGFNLVISDFSKFMSSFLYLHLRSLLFMLT